MPAPDADLAARHALHGYTREELSVMLRPIAQSGQDPVYSMGDDAPIAPSPDAPGRSPRTSGNASRR